ncbi:tectonic-1-like [Xenia sp. Carnegie-2017]|uniref:tectonic-1-like n=1 Tax=Xenia sp. Carnegie-2017 TaxID=2897299 RepID=UPI001F03E983|nr:tectonic-1-like [Xenia sp. Carnegie-2017]
MAVDNEEAFVYKVYSTLLLLSFVFIASGQLNGSVTNTGSVSGCICDLIVNGCDPNCCCDPDCSPSDKETFTECSETKFVVYDDRVCVSDQLIYVHNVPFRTINTGDGLLCIYRNNNKKQEEFSSVSTIEGNDDFTKAIKSRNLFSYQTNDNVEQGLGSQYKVGDAILILFPNKIRGFLNLPTTLISSSCNDFNAAGYFKDQKSQCTRNFADIKAECSRWTPLSASSYYSNFLVAKSPQLHSPATNITSNSSVLHSTYNESRFFAPQLAAPLLCRDVSGVLRECRFTTPPTPSYNTSTKRCDNVVTEVSYLLVYNNDSSTLKAMNVSLLLGNVRENFVQRFSIRFLKEGKEEAFVKSGNPGYLVGKPVLAGILQNNRATNKKAIILSTNNREWLTIPNASPDGSCASAANNRLPVTFNIEMRSGCMIRLNQTSNCSLLQDLVYSALLGTSLPEYVASFGNSDVQNVADWVKIIHDRPSNKPVGSGGVCSNMILGLHIEILFANVGYLAKPQAKILGTRFKYERPQRVFVRCFGQFCRSGGQNIEISSSVAFTDVSKPPEADQKSLPNFQSKAPSDFFHPFL